MGTREALAERCASADIVVVDSNPYAAPNQAPAPGGAPPFELGGIIQEAFEITKSQFSLLLGGLIVWGLVTTLACLTIIGLPLLVPILVWGLWAFLLRIVDGVGDMSALWSGFDNYRTALLRMLGLWLIFMPLGLIINSVAMAGEAMDAPVVMFIGHLIAFICGCVLTPFSFFAGCLIVDRDASIGESFSEAWRAIQGRTLTLALLYLLATIIMMLGLLALCVGLFFTAPMFYVIFAVAYRRLFPAREPEAQIL